MAELEESGDIHSDRGKKRGGVRAKKLSTRIDMTPMVDLGFLLVTFFILTTTMQKPKAMQVVMPDPDEKIDTTKIPDYEAVTLILGEKNRIFYYFGIDSPKVEVAKYSNITKILIDRNQEVKELQAQKAKEQKGATILIKPTDKSTYENVVDILDEMKISAIGRYAIVDVTEDELAMLPKQ